MGATTRELFGDKAVVEPATPGSYGLQPERYRLPAATRLGRVRLQVASIERSLSFYERTVGLRVVDRDANSVRLAANGDSRVLVELIERAGARPSGRGLSGLYHFAILLPNRQSLGQFVRHLAATHTRAGSGDHLVSEAFYLTDPDGLGIEVYADRPRETWQREGRELMISTDPVDMHGLMEAAGDTPWTGMPAGTVIGHVHLHVGDLAEASAFYSETLGFDRMTWRYPGALFLGAGGYHHHLGTNVWAGENAPAPTTDDAQLLEWTIEVPTTNDVAEVTQSLKVSLRAVDAMSPSTVRTRDPWGGQIRVVATEVAES